MTSVRRKAVFQQDNEPMTLDQAALQEARRSACFKNKISTVSISQSVLSHSKSSFTKSILIIVA